MNLSENFSTWPSRLRLAEHGAESICLRGFVLRKAWA